MRIIGIITANYPSVNMRRYTLSTINGLIYRQCVLIGRKQKPVLPCLLVCSNVSIGGNYMDDILKLAIKEKGLLLTDEQIALVVENYLANYERLKASVWDSTFILMEKNPLSFSIADLITYGHAKKYIYVVLQKDLEVIGRFFDKVFIQYEKTFLTENNNKIALITCVCANNERKEKLAHLIWNHIEKNCIKCGYYTLGWDDTAIKGEKDVKDFSVSLYRQLDTDQKIRLSNNYFRKDLHKAYRSSWEANIARIFNYLGISFEYEKELFQLEINGAHDCYTPDFFLGGNIIVEVKGFWDNESKNKVNLFVAQHKEYTLILVDADTYYSIEQRFSSLIPEWEVGAVKISNEVVNVVGITQGERPKNCKSLQIGEHLFLQRRPDNPYDYNAIMVLNADGGEIGYIPREWSLIYAQKIDMGIRYDVVVESIGAKFISVKMKRSNVDEIIIPVIFKGVLHHE